MRALLCLHGYTLYNANMSNEHKTIHEFDLNLICEFFLNTDRQGPGCPEVTRKALSFVDNLTHRSRIADLGCGTGGQTLVLAQHAPGTITGLDIFPEFIDRFNGNARASALQDRVWGVVGSMDDLPFGEESLDLIWSEGAIYNIGFERGLREWRKYLKPGGYLAVSECSWFSERRPAEIRDFWMESYPQIDTIPNQMARIQQAGYLPVASFILPETCWTAGYFTPLVHARKQLLDKYPGAKSAQELIAMSHHEELMYHRYKAFYGYTFFIAKKTGL